MTKPDKEAAINKAIEEMIMTGTGVIVVGEHEPSNSQRGLQEFIDEHLAAIAITLPIVVKQPASFACGYESGYKQALLDIEREFCEEPESLF